MQDLTEAFVELSAGPRRTCRRIWSRLLARARTREEPGSAAQGALETMLVNQEMSRRLSRPICQETGTPIVEVHYPVGRSTGAGPQIRQAVTIATEKSTCGPMP